MALEKTLKSPLDCKEIQQVHYKGNQSWVFIGRTDTEAETPVLWPLHAKLSHWKRLWCWEGLGVGGEGDHREWDGWMASLTRWTWVWVNSRSWWWTGRPDVLWFMGSQRVRHNRVTELNWTEMKQLNWTEWLFMLNNCVCAYWLFVYPLLWNVYSSLLIILNWVNYHLTDELWKSYM